MHHYGPNVILFHLKMEFKKLIAQPKKRSYKPAKHSSAMHLPYVQSTRPMTTTLGTAKAEI